MLHAVILALTLSSAAAPNAFPHPAFNAEVVRVRKVVNAIDTHLRVNPKIETGAGFARGFICIWDSELPKLGCLHTYVLDLTADAKAPVSTGVTKVTYQRVREKAGDCAKFIVTETAAGKPKAVNRSVCFINGSRLDDVIILDDDDPERQITARLVCLGDECDRKSK